MDSGGNERKRKIVESTQGQAGDATTKRVKKGESSISNISEIQHGLQTESVVAADDDIVMKDVDVADSHSVNSIYDTFQRSISSRFFRSCLVFLSDKGSGRLSDDEMTSAQIPPDKMDVLAPNISNILSEILSACKNLGTGLKDETLLDKNKLQERVRSQDAKRFGELVKKVTDISNEASPEEWKNKVNELVKDPFFYPRPRASGMSQSLEDPYVSEQREATIDAWNVPYQGSMHDALWEHIKESAADPACYAPMCAIIQSSGTGKSRMVDQLGTTHFVIPVCLRRLGEPGFPPSDEPVRSYFLASGKPSNEADVVYAQRRFDAFFKVLFDKTLGKLQDLEQTRVESTGNNDRYEMLASSFREAMTENQTFWSPNRFRSRFYEDVVISASAMVRSCEDPDGDFVSDVTSAFDRLSTYISAPKESSAKRQKAKPLIIIAFDESGVLSEPGEAIPVLDILRSRLSKLKHLSLFTLFISTTGQIAQSFRYNSMRIVSRQAKLCPAFTGCVFDEFALRPSPPRTLESVATEWYMLHLGRPLWATRISPQTCKMSSDSSMSSLPSHPALGPKSKSPTSNSLRRHAVEFAVAKLLNMSYLVESGEWSLTNEQCLACLAQRLPIEFLPTSFVNEQQKLVESHMRICLRVDPSKETMTTFSASEPILAEAAFVVMKNPDANILMSLQHIFDGFPVHPGERRGLIGHLLLLLARDDAVSMQNDEEMWTTMSLRVERKGGIWETIEWKRVITVPDFIKSLFVKEHIPQDILDSLEKHFGKVYVHFNHFIKAVEDDVASPKFLLGLLARGAGLICAENQEGIDGVIPCLKDGLLERGNVLHMTIQIRNRDMSRKSADWQFDPATMKYAVDDNKPVIRIFLNLGAQFPHFECKVTREHTRDGKAYTAIDFYCAGLSAEYLKPIAIRKDSDNWREEAWKGLLGTTRNWEHLYEPPFRSADPADGKYLRKMTPGVATKKEFWRFFWEEVE